MRFLLQLTATALLVAIGIGGMTPASAADRDARAAVIGRQKIREELSAALAKGYLTRMDQYHILLHAKEVLTADDLHGLEQTLDRLARQQAASRAATKVVRIETPIPRGTDDREPEMVMPSRYEELQAAAPPIAAAPMPKKATVASESPMMEEVPAGVGQPPADELDGDDPEDYGCNIEKNCRSCASSTSISSPPSMRSKDRLISPTPTAISACGWVSTPPCRSFPAWVWPSRAEPH